jgi:hypothetical protein
MKEKNLYKLVEVSTLDFLCWLGSDSGQGNMTCPEIGLHKKV